MLARVVLELVCKVLLEVCVAITRLKLTLERLLLAGSQLENHRLENHASPRKFFRKSFASHTPQVRLSTLAEQSRRAQEQSRTAQEQSRTAQEQSRTAQEHPGHVTCESTPKALENALKA